MKKRLLSLVLCAIMLFSACVLSACSEERGLTNSTGTIVTDSNNAPMTIYIYGIKEEGTTEAGIRLVEEELNKISIKKYNTTVDLLLFEEKEYASIVFAKTQEAMSTYNQKKKKDETITAEEKDLLVDVRFAETVKVADMVPSDVVNATLDIFLTYIPEADSLTRDPNSQYYSPDLSTKGMFDILYEQRALAPLGASIKSGTYSSLKNNAYTEALKCVERATYKTMDALNKVMDTYAIPNNYIYGEYQFVLFNSHYVNQFTSQQDKSQLLGDTAIATLANEIKAALDAGELLDPNGEVADINVTATYSSYEEFEKAINDKDVAICYINGDRAVKELCEQSGRFEVYQRSIGTITSKELCESMYCVSQSTADVNRCLDILRLINENEVFRNTLLYGVKGTHYVQERTGEVTLATPLNKGYRMNIKYTGNMFICYPCNSMTETMRLMAKEDWLHAKLQVKEVLDNNATS